MATRSCSPDGSVNSYERAGYGVDGVDATEVEASWVVPDAECGSAGFTIGVGMTDTVTGLGHTALVGTTVFCDYGEIYFTAGIDSNGTYPVQPDDLMHGSVTAKGNGLFALTLENHTAGWTGTGSYLSQDIIHPRAIVELTANFGNGQNSGSFPPITVSGATVDGAPLADSAPTRLVLIDPQGAPAVVPGQLASGSGEFTFTRAN